MGITNNPVIKCDMISITVTAGSTQTKLPFPDQPQLRGVFLQGIDFPQIENDIYGKQTLNTDSAAQSLSFLTLYFDGKENVRQMPLGELISDSSARTYNQNGTLGFYNQQLVWPKCYLTLVQPVSDPAQDLVFTFAIYYSTNKI